MKALYHDETVLSDCPQDVMREWTIYQFQQMPQQFLDANDIGVGVNVAGFFTYGAFGQITVVYYKCIAPVFPVQIAIPSSGTRAMRDNRERVAQFGDQYEQREGDDKINNNMMIWSLIFKYRKNEELDQLDRFLEDHGGVTPFFWRPPPPFDDEPIWVVCRDWSWQHDRDGVLTGIYAEFIQRPRTPILDA